MGAHPRGGGKKGGATLQKKDGSPPAVLAPGGGGIIVNGDSVELSPEDVELSRETQAGWGVLAEGGLTVALDLDITPQLRQEGIAREMVRLVQDARKSAGLEVTDRIELVVEAADEVADAVAVHRDWIAEEVLAVRLEIDAAELPGTQAVEG